MQAIAHTPAHAQHVPDGWSFPTLTPAQPPQAQPQPVRGGGGEPATVARLRWGRLLPMLGAVALIAFAIWTATSSPTPAARDASGGTVEIAPTTAADESTTTDSATADEAEAAAPAASAPATTPAPDAARRPAGSGNTRGGTRRGAAGTAGGTGAANAFAAASADASGPAAAGSPDGQLPVTGIETWIAGILGALLLGIGIVVHVNAVRLAATAMLYRRGVLLRPVECARLAQERGFPQLRVQVSNALHRLLAEPAGGSDFVSARHAL